ncbi:DUF423 domain-containing protein [Ancylobacter sp. A5.8]|uniref:DUF423 domain-containing protein n=1 Tax=Ancylobacter gelatini TaxID=2919920 RepID=UPI001F4F0A65|nr:DUF423 domain-containing protein [Ancylobacter gelatini]MCJ8141972.1 DUF423 domain-containing protein [Ancylobacter gelatini]
MTLFRRLIVFLAGLFGTAGVAAAAAGAHAFSDPALTTAATFLMIGACALAGTAALAIAQGPGWSFADVSGGLIALGTLLFSGALAGRVVWNVVIFPMAAPTGGTILMAGWLVLALAAFKRRGG